MKMKLATMVTLAVALVNARDAQAGILIPDYSPDGASLAIQATAGTFSVSSVTFTITGFGGNAWAGDYTVALQYADASTTISTPLFSSLLGGAAANNGFTGVTLNSSGSPGIASGASLSTAATPVPGAITGTFGGVDFSAFNNLTTAANGDWILFVTDNQSGEKGTLDSFSMTMSAVPEPVNVALAIFGGVMGVVVLQRKLGKQKAESKS